VIEIISNETIFDRLAILSVWRPAIGTKAGIAFEDAQQSQ